ncbi:MAG: 50S ribosomal protein L6 [Candidatus Woesearchaeota archaeon]|nr:50S ribosomal protein L6 [Candidatus Woesearchaeota archaeon]
MKIHIHEVIDIPQGITASIEGNLVTIKGKKDEVNKKLGDPIVIVKIEQNTFIIDCAKATRTEKAKAYAIIAHLNNMFKGVQEPYKYKLKICSGHFPMNCAVTNNQVTIKNFLGEKVPRIIKIKKGVSVKIDGVHIFVESANKELAGQTSADIEQATRIKGRDLRVFQDGIYIIEKASQPIEGMV